MATLVLIHGSWHGGWCWRDVENRLRARGHRVLAPTLSGCAERYHHASESVSLQTHIDDVDKLLFFEDLSEVILVGHSYAGMVVQGVANPGNDRLKALYFLDAYVVAEGQRGYDLWTEERRQEARRSIADAFPYRKAIDVAMLGITEPTQHAWVTARLTPHPLATYDTPMSPETPAGRALPRRYVHCTAGPLAPIFGPIARSLRERGWPIELLDAPHDAMLTHPAALAQSIHDFATGLGSVASIP